MRRIVILLLLLAGLAAGAGIGSQRAAVSINTNRVSDATFRNSLDVFANNANTRCYFSTVYAVAPHAGAARDSVTSSTASQWANTLLDGYAITNYEKVRNLAQSKADLARGKANLISQMRSQAQALQLNCPGTASEALASLPKSAQDLLIRSTAASIEMIHRLGTATPLTVAGLTSYYNAHQSSYDTLCISVAVVPQSQLAAFHADQLAGLSVKALVNKYSVEPQSKAKGGSLGCFAPTSNSYSTVRTDVAGQALNTFGAVPRAITYGGATDGLYVAVTSRKTNPFASIEQIVLNDVQTVNASSASAVQNNLLYQAAVALDPALGRWGLTSAGPEVFVPGVPKLANFDRHTLQLIVSRFAPRYQ